MNVIAPSIRRVLCHEQTCPCPSRRRDIRAVYGRNGKKSTSKFWTVSTIADMSQVPVGSIAAFVKECVGVVVGDGVYALRVVAALHEVPEHEIYGFLHLGNVPPAVPIEDLVQPSFAQQVASRHAEQMAGRPPPRIAEGEWDLPLPFEIVGYLPELIHGLRCLGHEILVVEDDYLLE